MSTRVDVDLRGRVLGMAEEVEQLGKIGLRDLLLVVAGLIDRDGTAIDPPRTWEGREDLNGFGDPEFWSDVQSVDGAFGKGLALLLKRTGRF